MNYSKRFLDAYRFFREHAGGCIGYSASHAFALAKAEERARDENMTVAWEEEDIPREDLRGEDETPPTYWVCAVVYDPREKDPKRREVIASLGGVGLESFRDPYCRVVSAEILCEALATLDRENDREWTHAASELAQRATYAGVSS